MEGDMHGYVEAGLVVIQLTTLACLWASIAVAFAVFKGFVTDTIPSMPRHLSGILTMREYGYGGSVRGVRDPISGYTLLQVVVIGIGISMLSILVWPLYIVIAVLYTTRAAYRARESIMELLRAMMNYRPERPSDSFIEKQVKLDELADKWSGMDVIEKTHRELQTACTCRGAPHDDDCAVVKDFVPIPPTYNKDNVPRWARDPDKEGS